MGVIYLYETGVIKGRGSMDKECPVCTISY